ncbi:MAG: DUF2156 domain-containing protein [Candidatus Niyogibacteria bacterium]|nr:DUF2156 domain-containing protein [Candidatus Niyogibacteria bacterium]
MTVTKSENIDEALLIFRDFVAKFHNDTYDFEFCNGYILQATRNYFDSRKFSDGLVIFTKKRGVDNFVIVSCVGDNRAKNIFAVVKELFENSGKPVFIKNVGKELEQDLLKFGCRHYRVDEWWDDQSKYDDNSFPEQVLNTKQLVDLEGPNFQSLREEQNRFNREYQIEARRWEVCNLETVEKILKKWIDNIHLRNDWNKEELHASHEIFCNSRNDLIHFGIYDSKNNKLIGFLAFSEISPKCLGYNVLVNDFVYRNSYRILMLEGARIANSLGYQYLNIQGSEDTNQYLSKRRLKAEFEIPKEHLIFDKNSCF